MIAAVLSLTLLGVALGWVLGLAARYLRVESNPVHEEIQQMLPGVNCGQCGYPGCSGAAEALELVVHGDVTTSKAVGRRIDHLDLPEGVTVGAIVRGVGLEAGGDGRRVLIAHGDTVIEAEDHVILFMVNKDLVPKVERFFQVGLGFF